MRWENTWEVEENLKGCDAMTNFQNNIDIDDEDLSPSGVAQGEEGMWEVHRIMEKSIKNGKVKCLFYSLSIDIFLSSNTFY